MTAPAVVDEDSNGTPGGESRALPFWPTFGVLYVFAAALLAWRLGTRPAGAYNWESYTLRGLIDFTHDPTWDVFRLNDGLMTDSGRSATVVGPAWVGFKTFGQTLLGLRAPIMLISALSAPLAWLLGRRLHSDIVGVTAALLVATSPVFLLYGRTGTIVGMSVPAALLGMLVLWNCLRPGEGAWWRWLIALQLVLIGLSYFYGVIRLLWVSALVLFAAEFLLRGGARGRFLASFGITAAALPVALMLLLPGAPRDPVEAIERYYNGREEHIFAINDNDQYNDFLRPESAAERAEIENASREELARKLLTRNARDLGELLLDRNTAPVITDYWNPGGRLYPMVLVPLFIAGMAQLGWRAFRAPEARFMLALFWGYSLPMIFTSNVHVGRLIFALPLLLIVVALPIESVTRALASLARPDNRPRIQSWLAASLGAGVVLLGAAPSLDDWRTPFPTLRAEMIGNQIAELGSEAEGGAIVYVFGARDGYEVESLRIAEVEISVDNVRYRDLMTGASRGTGSITVIYGGVLDLLAEPTAVPGYCANVYLVEPQALAQFIERTRDATGVCGHSLDYEVLPEFPLS
jgi:4-amino-4-deoxy-L-arabinose transferase-like glycosyltransferase